MADPGTSFDYDVVIAGGGMIGTSLALALSPLGLRVAVVEAIARSATSQPSFDDRSTALSRSTQRMFEAMGLWDRIRSASTPIRRIHVSEKGRFGFAHIDAEEQRCRRGRLGHPGLEALGDVQVVTIGVDAIIDRAHRREGRQAGCQRERTRLPIDGENLRRARLFGDAVS